MIFNKDDCKIVREAITLAGEEHISTLYRLEATTETYEFCSFIIS